MTTQVAIVCKSHKCLCNLSKLEEENIDSYTDFFYNHRLCDLTVDKLCSSYDLEDEGYGEYKTI